MVRVRNLLKAVSVVIVILGIAAVGGSIYYTNLRIDALESKLEVQKPQVIFDNSDGEKDSTGISFSIDESDSVTTNQQVKFGCDDECQTTVSALVDKYLAEAPNEVVTKTTTGPTPTNTESVSYIPMFAIYSTKNTSWVDVPGSDMYLDVAGDYGSASVVTFEVSLKVNDGNGRAYARLWDDTNKISPNNSEIYSENNSNYVTKITQPISIWNGNNLYKVQIRSLNTQEVFVNSARLKILY